MISQRDTVREAVKRIIDSIKPLADGFEELRDDDPLFSYGAEVPSPVNLDSLDALDLAMSLGEEFEMDNEEFDRIIESEEGIKSLRTVNDITDLILSLANDGGERTGTRALTNEGKEVMA